jgi:hypothetical protein
VKAVLLIQASEVPPRAAVAAIDNARSSNSCAVVVALALVCPRHSARLGAQQKVESGNCELRIAKCEMLWGHCLFGTKVRMQSRRLSTHYRVYVQFLTFGE